MKKICNYFTLKILSFRTLILLIIISLYQFFLFLEFIKKNSNYNVYDVLMHQFNYLTLFIFLFIGYMIIIYDINNNSKFYQYLNFKFKNRVQLYNINVLTILITSISFDIFLNILNIIECLGKVSFKNSWSDNFIYNNISKIQVNVFFNTDTVKLLINKLTPLEYIVYTNIFIISYLFLFGILFLVLNILIKRRMLTFLLVFLINFISYSSFNSNSIYGRYLITNNIYLLTSYKDMLISNTFITFRLFYWIFLISIVYLLGIFLSKKSDLRYEV